jgi:drug/metabolite transporter (DMT)-like permease
MNFFTILILSLLSLLAPLPANLSVKVNPEVWPALIVSGLVLGAATLVGYLFNNFGIRLIGAARASIVGASGPAITAILAFLVIHETLQIKQILGMILVTLGVFALSFERLQKQVRAAKAKKEAA